MRTLEEYLDLPYTIEIVHDRDDDGAEGYVAEVKELPGCVGQGETIEEAAVRVQDAMVGWISVALEDGAAIPEPRDLAGQVGGPTLAVAPARAREVGVTIGPTEMVDWCASHRTQWLNHAALTASAIGFAARRLHRTSQSSRPPDQL